MIGIIDYGVGNLFSLCSSLKSIGAEVAVTSDPAVIEAADKLILPGVGAFGDAVKKLRDSGLYGILRMQAAAGKDIMGICLGMQLSIVEFARNVAGLKDAHSIELDPSTTHPVIALMPDQSGVEDIGGTLRLGSYPCVLDESSMAYELYGKKTIYERHRHRYEVNNDFRTVLTKHGMKLSGLSPDGRIVEMCELPEHPFFIATQGHPELKSRPNRPHPLFKGFIRAAIEAK